MFNRDEFMSYVGSASGSSYAAGLKAIESIYGVDVDAEYTEDKCRNLFYKLEQDKKSTELNKTELKRRSDMTSHLKKYVEYRENTTAMEQRKLFVSWMQDQPRRDDPTKRYSIETINGAADKLQSGLKKLGVFKYTEVNCFTITVPEYFAELHKACYAKAEESDKKQGHRDFRNGLDFYMQFLNEQNYTSITPASPMHPMMIPGANHAPAQTRQQLMPNPRISAPTTPTPMAYMVAFCVAEASSRWSCSNLFSSLGTYLLRIRLISACSLAE